MHMLIDCPSWPPYPRGASQSWVCACTESIWSSSDDRFCRSADVHYIELFFKEICITNCLFLPTPLWGSSVVLLENRKWYIILHLSRNCHRVPPRASQTLTHSSQSSGERSQNYALPSFDFPGSSDAKEFACSAGDPSSIPGLGLSPGGGHDYPLQYSSLENSIIRRAWQGTAHRVRRS